MTDERKPETPGLAEVSPKFADEAEATATEEIAAHDPMLVLRAERQGLIAEVAATPEDKDAALWPRLKDVEKRILTAEPQTLLGALAQIEVLASMADEGVPEFAAGVLAGMNEQMPARIERLLAASFGGASVIDDPLIALGRQWQEAYRNWDALDGDRAELLKIVCELEDKAAKIPAFSIEGVLVKLRIAGAHYHLMERHGEDWDNIYARLTWQAWDGLERLVGESTAEALASVAEPDDPVVALRQRWEKVMVERGQLKNRDDDNPKHPDVIEDQRLHGVQLEIEKSIADTPTHTAAGIAVKLRQIQRDDEDFDGMGSWRPAAFRTALEALGRVTMPAIEDPVLALKREWDARWERYASETDESDEVVGPLHDALSKAEFAIHRTPATTMAGVAIKLKLWARTHVPAVLSVPLEDPSDWWSIPLGEFANELDRLPVASAVQDLERLSKGQ